MGNQTSGIKKFTEDDIFYSSLKANKDKVILIRKNLDQLFNNNDKKRAYWNPLNHRESLPLHKIKACIASEKQKNSKALAVNYAIDILNYPKEKTKLVKAPTSMHTYRSVISDISDNLFNSDDATQQIMSRFEFITLFDFAVIRQLEDFLEKENPPL